MEARARLSSVRERVEAIGGRILLTPDAGQGMVVRVELRGAL
jgi:signal transduction histidine kinase